MKAIDQFNTRCPKCSTGFSAGEVLVYVISPTVVHDPTISTQHVLLHLAHLRCVKEDE